MEYHFSTREKNGGICLILSYKVNRKWRQKSRQGFKTKKEARAAQDDLLDAARKDAESGSFPELAGITLRDFTEKIFLRDKKNSIEYGTSVLYRQSIARVPSIADKPLHDITEGEVINAYNALAGKLEISTRNQTLAKVKTIFSYAVRTYHIRLDNPVLAVAIDKDKREKKIKAFTKEEADQLVESIENPTLRLAVLISLNTGMRFAEVAGLTWADIDFFKRTITVNKQWGTRKDGSKGFKPPKSRNGYRTLHLTARLAAALQEWKQSSPRSIDGRILPELERKKHSLNRAISKFKPGMHMHSLRHTFATLLLSETQDINLVAAVLGDTPATVYNTYIHYTQDIRKKADGYIEAIFGN